MAQIPSTKALTESDGLNELFNVNTVAKAVQLPNGMALVQYADNYVTPGLQLLGGTFAVLSSSGAAQVLTNNATINTAGIGRARVAPGAAVTGIILQPGTVDGQMCMVTNTSAAGNNVTFAAAGTSNVADGATAAINGLQSRLFVWDAGTSLWYRMN